MWFGRRRDPRIGDELRFHRDRLIDDYMAAGMDRAEATRQAFLRLGNVAQVEEAVRDVRGRWLEDLAKDLRYTLRTLRRSPGFSIVATLSFALGIGANVAIFTLINAVMLRTLPVREPHRLVQITRLLDGYPGQVSYPLFEQFRDNVKSISGAFAQASVNQAVVVDGQEEFVTAELVSGDYYTVLGIEPAAGRLLGTADMQSGSTPGAVISTRYWQQRFGGSPSALGKTVTIRDQVFTIVGVTPASFEGVRPGQSPDLTLPLVATMMSETQRRSTDFNWLKVLARLEPGATVDQANAEAQVLFQSFVESQAARAADKERARDSSSARRRVSGARRLQCAPRQHLAAAADPDGDRGADPAARVREPVGPAARARRGAAARDLDPARDWRGSRPSRPAVPDGEPGARRNGASIGLVLADWFSARLFALFVNGRDLQLSVSPDWRVLAFTTMVAILACCIAGLAPALRAVRVNVNPTLKEVRAHGHRRFGRALVVVQLAISMMLVVGATLFVGTLMALRAVDRGFDASSVLVVSVRTARPYPEARRAIVQQALIERLAALPGVQSASTAQMLPLGGGLWDRRVQVEGYVFRPDEPEQVGFNVIGADYFATIGTPIVAGREFDARETDTSPKVAIVNESFARHFFGNQSAIGRHVTSVGVDLRDRRRCARREVPGPSLGRDENAVHLLDATGWRSAHAVQLPRAECRRRSAASGPAVERLVREVDPALHLTAATNYETIVDRSIANRTHHGHARRRVRRPGGRRRRPRRLWRARVPGRAADQRAGRAHGSRGQPWRDDRPGPAGRDGHDPGRRRDRRRWRACRNGTCPQHALRPARRPSRARFWWPRWCSRPWRLRQAGCRRVAPRASIRSSRSATSSRLLKTQRLKPCATMLNAET